MPPIQVPAGYPLQLADTSAQAVAEAAVNDARMRWWLGSDAGLRGGSFTAHGDAVVTLRLHDVRFRQDATVSGTRALGARERLGGRRRGRAQRSRLAHAGAPGVRRSVIGAAPSNALDGGQRQA